MPTHGSEGERLAGGGVVLRRDREGSIEVLLVHRPRYNDWSFPKGKLDEGESLEEAAVREVREETGLRSRIVRKLSVARYDYRTADGSRKPKAVHYFLMEPVKGTLRSRFDEEIDSVEWVPVREAASRLSYEFDRALLSQVVPGDAGSA
jgi:8-oxo-dGTP diphosphatase